MTLFDRKEMDAGAAMARRALGKPEPTTPATPAQTKAECREAWLAEMSAEQRGDALSPQTCAKQPSRTAVMVDAAARDYGRSPSTYAIGERKVAMDGTVWTRAA